MQMPGYLGFAPLTIMYYYNDTVLHIYKRYMTARDKEGERTREKKVETGRNFENVRYYVPRIRYSKKAP